MTLHGQISELIALGFTFKEAYSIVSEQEREKTKQEEAKIKQVEAQEKTKQVERRRKYTKVNYLVLTMTLTICYSPIFNICHPSPTHNISVVVHGKILQLMQLSTNHICYLYCLYSMARI